MHSDLSGFHKLSPAERLEKLKSLANLSEEEAEALKAGLGMETADRMIENVVGIAAFPLGIATNFVINGRDVLVPMALEEPSVVAAASYAAKLARPDGFMAESNEPVMIGQIQLVGSKNPEKAVNDIIENKRHIIELCNKKDPVLISFGGGVRDVEARVISTETGKMVIVHILVDVRDAMGANAINTMAEAAAPLLEELTGGSVRLRIISNLAVKRMARAKAVWKKDVIGEDTVNGIIDAYHFAKNDVYRCATHNKGIMNGIDAVVIATGNDFRAVEAGCHAYAAMGSYKPLTKYEKNKNGDLVGTIELPLAIGTIGGATRTNPVARVALKILGAKTSKELAVIVASVGLAQNFAALRALSTEGIQHGHMQLHAKNMAIMAGAKGDEIEIVAEQMAKEKNIGAARAKELLSR